MNLVLIGYRGSGKSTVATRLSDSLQIPIVSIDSSIEKRVGRTIREIVDTKGWERFRKIESEVIEVVSNMDSVIIDAGGGVVLDPDNVRRLRANGIVFWLSARVETIAARIGDDPLRPSLTGVKSTREEIREVLESRLQLYRAASDFTIETDDTTPEAIVAIIEQNWQLRSRG